MIKRLVLAVFAVTFALTIVPTNTFASGLFVKYCFQEKCMRVRQATTVGQCIYNQRCAGNTLGAGQCNSSYAPWKGFIGTDPDWKPYCQSATANDKTVWAIGFGARSRSAVASPEPTQPRSKNSLRRTAAREAGLPGAISEGVATERGTRLRR
jgi:hypothetical protein